MSALPEIPYNVLSGANPGFVPYVLSHGWDSTINGWFPIPIREMINTSESLVIANDNLAQIKTHTGTLAANEPPSNTQNACVSLSAGSAHVVKASAGTVYGIASDKDVEVRDNTTAKIICPSTFMRCPAPVSFGSNITLYSQTPSLVTVWYV